MTRPVSRLAAAVDAAFAFGDEGGGRAFSEAWLGLGSTLVQEVRLVKGADVLDVGD